MPLWQTRRSRSADCAWQLILGIFIAFCLSCPVIWQWSGVMNCSIKATLRIENTLDAQPLGIRVVQLLWRTRLLLATDNQRVTLIIRQMGLFMRPSRLIERRSLRLMIWRFHTGRSRICISNGKRSAFRGERLLVFPRIEQNKQCFPGPTVWNRRRTCSKQH